MTTSAADSAMSGIHAHQAFPTPRFPEAMERAGLAAAFPTIDREFEALYRQRRLPAVTYGVVIDGQLAHSAALGLADIEADRPATIDSVFRIASMTKSFTAMAILILRDAGRLQLDRPAAEYVPELAALRGPTRDSAPISVRDLLTMGAGFPQDDPWADRQLALSEEGLSALLARGTGPGGLLFSNPPGITFEYSNLGYAILGRIVTNVAGMRYQDFVTERILRPLGMASTTFDHDQVPPGRLAMGYRILDGAWVPDPPLADGAFASIGGLFTTIPDFARYMAFLMDAYPPRSEADGSEIPNPGAPVRRATVREMQAIQRVRHTASFRMAPSEPLIVRTPGYGYGLNPMIDSTLGMTVSHGGGLPGYGSYYRMLPEYGVGIVSFSNLTYGGADFAFPGMDARIHDSLLALRATGQMRPRAYPASTALQDVQARFRTLYERAELPWDETRAEELNALFTDTFFMDASADRRGATLARLYAELGPCHAMTPPEPENALRGRWRMDCERGALEVFVTLAPVAPPRVQYWALSIVKPLSTAQARAVRGFVRLVNRFDIRHVRAVLGPTLTVAWAEQQCRALRVQYGALWAGNLLEGDGETRARVRLEGDHGSVDMLFTVDEQGLIRALSFTLPRETDFMR